MHMLFCETKHCIITGNYLCTDTEALLLAALVMQIEYVLLLCAGGRGYTLHYEYIICINPPTTGHRNAK